MEISTNLGRVSLAPRGEYDPQAQYRRLDIVGYGGSSYLALRDLQGVTPENGADYMLIAQRGDVGAAGETGPQGEQGVQGEKGDTGEKGGAGDTGNGIAGIERTSGSGAAGTTDTYTITMTDGSTSAFQVYNGADGAGAGDMTKSVYDSQNKNTDVFAYVDEAVKGVKIDVDEAPAEGSENPVSSGGTFAALAAKQDALTGRPGQVVGFGADGAAEAVQGWSGPNLGINCDFRCPVNRNGRDEYTAAGMTIDRWSLSMSGPGISLRVLPEGGVSLDKTQGGVFGRLSQRLDNPSGLSGQTVTVSILAKGNTTPYLLLFLNGEGSGAGLINIPLTDEYSLYSVTKTLRSGDITRVDAAVGYQTATPAGSSALLGMKVEMGSHQTLAHQDGDGNWMLNDPPDYALQYALCSLYSPITGEWIGSRHSNPNLLDNWYFADPINQRGQAEYDSAGYTIDRWALKAGVSIKLLAGDIEFSAPNSGDWNQILDGGFDLIKGKTFTISYLTMDNVLVFGSGTVPSNAPSATTLYLSASEEVRCAFGYSTVHKHPFVSFAAGSKTSAKIVAVKLELGPVQTLAHQDKDGNWVLNDPPPNKALELAKCQRYQIVLAPESRYIASLYSDGLRGSIFVPTPAALRANPTIGAAAFNAVINGELVNNVTVTSAVAAQNGVIITFTLETAKSKYAIAVANIKTRTILDANL